MSVNVTTKNIPMTPVKLYCETCQQCVPLRAALEWIDCDGAPVIRRPDGTIGIDVCNANLDYQISSVWCAVCGDLLGCDEKDILSKIGAENQTYTFEQLCNIYDDDACDFEQYFAKQLGVEINPDDTTFEQQVSRFKGRVFEIVPNTDYIRFNGKLNSDFRLRESK